MNDCSTEAVSARPKSSSLTTGGDINFDNKCWDLGKNNAMVFGIDFDNTITADPQLFKHLINSIRMYGHKVYIVTYRYGPLSHASNNDIYVWHDKVDGIIFTEHQAKRKFVWDNQQIRIDIWMDDTPDSITTTEYYNTPDPIRDFKYT